MFWSDTEWLFAKAFHRHSLGSQITAWKEGIARWGLASSPEQQVTGEEEMASRCAREGSAWTSGGIFFWKHWNRGKWWIHHDSKCSRNSWVWHLVLWLECWWLVKCWTQWSWRSLPTLIIQWFYTVISISFILLAI